jgi:hypothetical protein
LLGFVREINARKAEMLDHYRMEKEALVSLVEYSKRLANYDAIA